MRKIIKKFKSKNKNDYEIINEAFCVEENKPDFQLIPDGGYFCSNNS